MRVGTFNATSLGSVDDALTWSRAATAAGFDTLWFPQVLGLDALTALAVVAREIPDVHLGTAVVPIQGRHPLPLAFQALTVSSAAGPGRFSFGIGVTHRTMSEGFFGVPYRGIVDVCAEVLTALNGLLGPDRKADVDGAHLSTHSVAMIDAPAPGLLLAGLAPRMVDLAGSQADGTITWMTGPTTLGRDITPALGAAADRVGRAAPRVVVGIQVCVTDDVTGARERVASMMARSASMPAYQRQMAAEGLTDPVDLVVLGDEDAVAARFDAYRSAGMTELCANVVGSPEEQARTTAFLTGPWRDTVRS
jgi:5,10-methylenetetrahydromethanopterin reductase